MITYHQDIQLTPSTKQLIIITPCQEEQTHSDQTRAENRRRDQMQMQFSIKTHNEDESLYSWAAFASGLEAASATLLASVHSAACLAGMAVSNTEAMEVGMAGVMKID